MSVHRYLLHVTTINDREIWTGLEIAEEYDVTMYDALIPVASLNASDVEKKNVSSWLPIEGDPHRVLAELGAVKLEIV